jgi:phosphoribosylaminoimidazole-succinocarboxamide synthase
MTNLNYMPDYTGKVRDVFYLTPDRIGMCVSDRISAFDVILPVEIPGKGAVLNQLAAFFLNQTSATVPNWLKEVPHPRISIGLKCEPIRVEVVIRGYLAGHALRLYQSGKREICGVQLPDGLAPYSELPTPILTPTIKAEEGHDTDISVADILSQKLVSETDWQQIELYALALYASGSSYAETRDLILADTKYEFGLYDGKIILMDEVHTPDSSRYFEKSTYAQRIAEGKAPEQLSKEFVRQWLIENGFSGQEGEVLPLISADWANGISFRYMELYRRLVPEPLKLPAVSEDNPSTWATILNSYRC